MTMARDSAELDRLIDEGLALYGQGDLDGALITWERVLAADPSNAQALSYVEHVRAHYDLLRSAGDQTQSAPFAIADDGEPDYQIEIVPGEVLTPSAAPMVVDSVDEGWSIEAERTASAAAPLGESPLTLELEGHDPSEAGISFEDATREYQGAGRRPSAAHEIAAPGQAGEAPSGGEGGPPSAGFDELTVVHERNLSNPRRATVAGPEAGTGTAGASAWPALTAFEQSYAEAELELSLPGPGEQGEAASEPTGALAPPHAEPAVDPLVSAPTRDLGLRAEATRAYGELEASSDEPGAAGDGTRADLVLPFDMIEVEGARILDDIDRTAPADEPPDDQLRRRITSLIERATRWSSAGELERAAIAVELAMSEAPDSALAQKLIQRHRDAIMAVCHAYLGELERQPSLARPLHELAAAPISPRAAFLLSRVDGTLSIDEILDVSGMPRLEAFRYLCQLHLRGILQ